MHGRPTKKRKIDDPRLIKINESEDCLAQLPKNVRLYLFSFLSTGKKLETREINRVTESDINSFKEVQDYLNFPSLLKYKLNELRKSPNYREIKLNKQFISDVHQEIMTFIKGQSDGHKEAVTDIDNLATHIKQCLDKELKKYIEEFTAENFTKPNNEKISFGDYISESLGVLACKERFIENVESDRAIAQEIAGELISFVKKYKECYEEYEMESSPKFKA